MRFLLGVHPKSAIQKLSFMRVFWGVHPNSEILFSFEVFLLGSATKLPNLKVFFITFFESSPKFRNAFLTPKLGNPKALRNFLLGSSEFTQTPKSFFHYKFLGAFTPNLKFVLIPAFRGGYPKLGNPKSFFIQVREFTRTPKKSKSPFIRGLCEFSLLGGGNCPKLLNPFFSLEVLWRVHPNSEIRNAFFIIEVFWELQLKSEIPFHYNKWFVGSPVWDISFISERAQDKQLCQIRYHCGRMEAWC